MAGNTPIMDRRYHSDARRDHGGWAVMAGNTPIMDRRYPAGLVWRHGGLW